VSTASSKSIGLIACAVLATPALASGIESAKPADTSFSGKTAGQSIVELRRAAAGTNGKIFTSAAWSPDGRLIATGGGDSDIEIWKAEDLSAVRSLKVDRRGFAAGSQHSLAFSADGRLLVGGSLLVSAWETATWQSKTQFVGPSAAWPQPFGIKSVTFSPDQTLLIVAYQSLRQSPPIVAFRVHDATEAWAYQPQSTIGLPAIDTSLTTLANRNQVAFGTGETTAESKRFSRIVILDAKSGSLVRTIDNIHVDRPTALAASPDGRWFATATNTGYMENSINPKDKSVVKFENHDPIRIWDVATGSLVRELPVQQRTWALIFSPDAKFLIASQTDAPANTSLLIWDLGTGVLVQSMVAPRDAGYAFGLAFNPSGRQIAAAGRGIAVYDYRP
jgi:WD40 repeat protein